MAILGTMNGMESGAFVPQVVDTLHSWFTPTVLFLVLNIVIGTIAVTSRMRLNHNNPNNNLRRNPSLLARLSSINFTRRTYEEEPPLVVWDGPQDTETVEDNVVEEQKEEMEEEKTSEVKDVDGGGGVSSTKGLSQRAVQKKSAPGRSKSDSQQLSDPSPPPPPLPGKMHKYKTFEGPQSARKPPVSCAVVRNPPTKTVEHDEEEESGADAEVNAKADDFINKFKQQLKLQRLESLVRYKDMLGRSK